MAQLEHSAGIDPAILRRFEKNREALDELIAQVSKRERDSTTIREKIDTLLRNFDPALDSLVQVVSDKFGAAFEKVGCSGEVRVDRVEGDFRNWGIQILVSYRNEEGLALLTSNRQSGGVGLVTGPGLMIGTILSYRHIPHESIRDGKNALFPRGRDQSGQSSSHQ